MASRIGAKIPAGVVRGVINDIGGVLDRLFPAPEQRAEAEPAQKEIAGLPALKQIDLAGQPSLFVTGWRPTIGWICALALAWAFLLQPGGAVGRRHLRSRRRSAGRRHRTSLRDGARHARHRRPAHLREDESALNAMAWTQAELDALKRAYASGTLRVSYDGKTVEYGSEADLIRRIRTIEGEIAVLSGNPKPRRSLARFAKG